MVEFDVFWWSKLHVFAQKREGFIFELLLVFVELRGFKGRTQWLGGILVRGILVVRVFWGAGI